jgi:glycogen debranching enzyme
MGPFVEAWVRVRGGTAEARREARGRFLDPLLRHLDDAGLGHLPEVADGDPPHTAGGCPFQAWSVSEALRLDLGVLRAAAEAETTGVPGVW